MDKYLTVCYLQYQGRKTGYYQLYNAQNASFSVITSQDRMLWILLSTKIELMQNNNKKITQSATAKDCG